MSKQRESVAQTAERLGVSDKWIRSRVHNGTLPFPYQKVGKLLRFDPMDVENYIESVTRRPEAVTS
jgi:excisionase family DNA binding protein